MTPKTDRDRQTETGRPDPESGQYIAMETKTMTPADLIKEIKTLRQTVRDSLQTGDLETLSDPKTRSLIDWLERETQDQTPSPIFNMTRETLRSLTEEIESERLSLWSLFDRVNLSETLTLSDLEIGDRVRLTRSGVFWSVLHMTPESDRSDQYIQIRSVKSGQTKTINLTDQDSRVWIDPDLSLETLDSIQDLIESLERLTETLGHKTRDLEIGDQIEDQTDRRLYTILEIGSFGDLTVYDHNQERDRLSGSWVSLRLETGSLVWRPRPKTETQEKIDQSVQEIKTLTPEIFESETPDPEIDPDQDTIILLEIGDLVSSVWRSLTIWSVREIDPESETVTLRRSGLGYDPEDPETETQIHTFGSLFQSWKIGLLEVQKTGQSDRLRKEYGSDLVLAIDGRLSSDPEEIETRQTWRDPESGDLRSRVLAMIRETDSLLSDYDRTLSEIVSLRSLIVNLARVKTDPADLTDQEWSDLDYRSTDPDLWRKKEIETLRSYLIDRQETREDLGDLAVSIYGLAMEIERRSEDPGDPDSDFLDLFDQVLTETMIKISETLTGLKDPADPKDQRETVNLIGSDLVFLETVTLSVSSVNLSDPESETLTDPERLEVQRQTVKTRESLQVLISVFVQDQIEDLGLWADLETIKTMIETLRLTVKTLETMTLDRMTPSLTDRETLSQISGSLESLCLYWISLTEEIESDPIIDLTDCLEIFESYKDLIRSAGSLGLDCLKVSKSGDFDSGQLTRSLIGLTRDLERLETVSGSDWLLSETDPEDPEDLTESLESLTKTPEDSDLFGLLSETLPDQIQDLRDRLRVWKRQTQETGDSLEDLESLSVFSLLTRLSSVKSLILDLDWPEDPEDLDSISLLTGLLSSLIRDLTEIKDLIVSESRSRTAGLYGLLTDPETPETADQIFDRLGDSQTDSGSLRSYVRDLIRSDRESEVYDLEDLRLSLSREEIETLIETVKSETPDPETDQTRSQSQTRTLDQTRGLLTGDSLSDSIIGSAGLRVLADRLTERSSLLTRQTKTLIRILIDQTDRLFDPRLFDHYQTDPETAVKILARLETLEDLESEISDLSRKIETETLETSDLVFGFYRTFGLDQYDIETPILETPETVSETPKDPETDSQTPKNDPETVSD